MSNYLERIGQDKIEDREEIEQLTAIVRELEAENVRLSDGAVCGDCDGSGWLENRVEGRYPCTCMTEAEPYQLLAEQLAGAQLNNKLLQEALTTCVCAMQDYQAGIGITEMFDKGERLGRKALSTPISTEALDKYVADKVKEAMK